MLEPTNHREPNKPREPELPVVEDPVDPGEPRIPEMPPPVPDPPEIVGVGYGSEESYYRPEGWEPASWQPHPLPEPASVQRRGVRGARYDPSALPDRRRRRSLRAAP